MLLIEPMLTIAEALALEPFANSRVIAGEGGLNHTISWVHVAAVPDAARWLNGGELVLTTVINLPPDAEGQCAYVQALADKGVAGLALAVGNTIDHAPDYLRSVAERNDFPLIEIPFDVRFVDVARVVNERITQANMALVTRALHINRVLTQLVLDGGDLKDLASTLAELIVQSISIENERFEALASVNIAPVDEARRYTLSEGRTDPRLVQALEERGVLSQIRGTLRPVFIPQMADVGLEMERILAPIVVHGAIYGYVWIIADDRPLNELDHMAIESGATIAALMLLHQEAMQNAESSLKGNLITQLIEGVNGREAVVTDQALRFGVDFAQSFYVVVVHDADSSSQKLVQLYRRINHALESQSALAGQFAGQIVILAQGDVAGLTQLVLAQAAHIRVGVSATVRGVAQVGLAYQQSREALDIAQRLKIAEAVVYFQNLGYLHTLYQAGPESLALNPYVPGLRKLHDEQQADLFNTLETYLDAGGNSVQTAKSLHIHRSTLNYRLERIREVCGCDLSDPLTRMNLQVAIKLARLFQKEWQ
ncbi:MAG: PucR family transcriptional regulator ligand-binding domain-containing protein [Anaerolineae bacterium]|nr:PucR family transcriptional regulator ligand-binding domain-containing protein [Anaerolineae bacterium]